MRYEFIIIGVFVLIFVFLAVLYYVNGKKIKGKQTKKEEQKKEKSEKKIEVKAEMLKETPIETAIKEANIESHMEEAFKKIEDERKMFEEKNEGLNRRKSRLTVERDDFKTELQKSLEIAKISSETNVLKSQTAKMDYETEANKNTEAEVTKDEIDKSKSLAEEIEKLSPEMKAILIDNLLNKKY